MVIMTFSSALESRLVQLQRHLRLEVSLRRLHDHPTDTIWKADLEGRGTPLSDADVLIAATAMDRRAALITGNVAHFSRFPALRLDNWLR